MVHQMGIHHHYFEAIKAGEKIADVRLNDLNKQKIKVGDTIQFISFPNQDEILKVKVVCLKKYETFTELYQNIPLEYFTSEKCDANDLLNETYEIYDPELEKQWGALAIIVQP